MSKSNKILKIAVDNGYCVDKNGIVFRKGVKRNTNISNGGYERFTVRVNGCLKSILVHRLQAYQKFGDKLFKNGIEVRHLDNNKTNNNFDNIGIGARSDNMMDIDKNIRIKKAIKASYNRRNKISDEVTVDILKDRSLGFTYKMLTDKYGLAKGTLSFLFNKSLYANKF